MWKGELGMRPPASPSCRLYLRAGSRRGIGPTPRREGGMWKGECGRWNWECGLRPLRAVGSTSRKPACKPPAYKSTGWPPARSGTILRLGEKRPRREGGRRKRRGWGEWEDGGKGDGGMRGRGEWGIRRTTIFLVW
jgi:hypothetical protein